ncbi:transketolase [Candidatus Woesearchaeota archaeon]|nr:transketolase [Candidatus Woesearchaeota archaeon]
MFKKLEEVKELKLKANEVRQELIKMLAEAGSGHTAGPLGIADILTVLYFNVLEHDSKNPLWEGRDRFILSNGHCVPARYAVMALAGYFPTTELKTLRKFGSRLQGHPDRIVLPALEASTGSLGQGICMAAGMALAAKLNGQMHKIYCMISDGELDEGSTWEALNACHRFKLNNLIILVDRNNIQISGRTEEVWPLEPMKEKLEAFNLQVYEVDGHSIPGLIHLLNRARNREKTQVIICKNTPGKGVSFCQNYTWHGKTPTKEEAKLALHELEEERKKILKEN